MIATIAPTSAERQAREAERVRERRERQREADRHHARASRRAAAWLGRLRKKGTRRVRIDEDGEALRRERLDEPAGAEERVARVEDRAA